MMASGIRALLEQISGSASRSTVLKPLGWALALFVPGTVVSAWLGLSLWLVGTFATLMALSAALYLAAYVYCLFKDRDALRSESYSIQKLAIEKQLVGDDRAGILELEIEPATNRLLIGSGSDKADK